MILLTFLILSSLISCINSFLCDTQESLYCKKFDLCMFEFYNASNSVIHDDQCSLDTDFIPNEYAKHKFGEIYLHLNHRNYTTRLKTSVLFSDKNYKDAYLKLSEYVDTASQNCKQLTFKSKDQYEKDAIIYNCQWNSFKELESKNYLLEITTVKDFLYMPRKLLFRIPEPLLFDDSVSVFKRLIFSYIDFTSIHKVILKIQPLPEFYNVTHYKIEVYKEKDQKVHMVDVRLIPHDPKAQLLSFEYLTYSEEGYHYFAVSVISSQCPEDYCKKSVTARLYISRKGTPLVIGIVGASFLIPLVMYIFYIWSCKIRRTGLITTTSEKVLILYHPSFDKHNEVVATLARTITHLTGLEVMIDPLNVQRNKKDKSCKLCVDHLILASYIIYITPPAAREGARELECCGLDCMTYSFLKKEAAATTSEKKIVVVYFEYTDSEAPLILSSCSKFKLMKEFSEFMNIFRCLSENLNYKSDLVCKGLSEKIQGTQTEIDTLLTSLPEIVINYSDTSVEPKEIDVLL